jgi:hypothetical protein
MLFCGVCSSHANEYTKTELRGFSPKANYADRATAECRKS